jgi:hypothetical protein
MKLSLQAALLLGVALLPLAFGAGDDPTTSLPGVTDLSALVLLALHCLALTEDRSGNGTRLTGALKMLPAVLPLACSARQLCCRP